MTPNQIRLAALLCILQLFSAAGGLPAADPAEKPYGIQQRIPWNTSQVVGTPDPPPPFHTQVAFPELKFDSPLELISGPGGRMYVVERYGKIYSFPVDPAARDPHLFTDLGRTVYGFAFHPQFEQNRYVYAVHVIDPGDPTETGTRLVRLKADASDPPRCDPKSETLLLEWPSGGHNGGCLRFGPDGFLYIVTGDASGIADQRETGQDISDLPASLLRIDVDRRAGGKPYGIPPDNPFVKQAGARPEVYAYGLRQAWRFSFDPPTGQLWAGEVGQDLWEMVYLIERGGNYGWSVKEGTHPFRPERPRGPTPIRTPIVEHSHSEFRSITGGYVYHGKEFPELAGMYVYGDYDTGKIWALRYEQGRVTQQQELADTALRIVAFGQDHAGELYPLDFIDGRIHKLVRLPKSAPQQPFPRKLSETGLFASTKDHQPAAGLIPYSVNSPLWSDHAVKERFIAIPGDARIEFETVTYPQPAPGAPPGWRFPDGSVLVKTFSLEMEAGKPESRRRLETRILHVERTPGTEEVGDQVWRGYTYLWNDAQTDAVLLEGRQGLDRTFTVRDPAAPGGRREQVWHFPSRSECTLCHTTPAKYVLGLNTRQMNKDHNYGDVTDNQLRTLAHIGLFTAPLPQPPAALPRLADYTDESQPLDARARSYLHSNCSHCHMKWGGGNAEFQLLATMDVGQLGVIGTRPGQGQFKLNDPRILVPGDPERSMIYHRMQLTGLGRMPHVASSLHDQQAIKLIGEWIKSLPKDLKGE